MSALNGKWKYSVADTTGLDEFLAAAGKPELGPVYRRDTIIESFVEGNSYSSTFLNEGGVTFSVKGQLGKLTSIELPGLGQIEVLSTVENDQYVQVNKYDGLTVTSKLRLEGDVAVLEITANGKTSIARMKRA